MRDIVDTMQRVAPGLLAFSLTASASCIYVDNDEFVDDDEVDSGGCLEVDRSPYTYHLCDVDPRTWDAAQSACADFGPGVQLASIADETENQFVGSRVGESSWIGGRFDGQWMWSDGTAFAFTSWGSGFNTDPELDGIEIAPGGGWTNVNSSTRLGYVCKGPESG